MNWIKENWFKLGILFLTALIIGYMIFYFSYLIPHREQVKSEQDRLDRASQELKDKESKALLDSQKQSTDQQEVSIPVSTKSTSVTPKKDTALLIEQCKQKYQVNQEWESEQDFMNAMAEARRELNQSGQPGEDITTYFFPIKTQYFGDKYLKCIGG